MAQKMLYTKGAFFPLFRLYYLRKVSKFLSWNNENVAILTMSVSPSPRRRVDDSDKGTTFRRKNARLCGEILPCEAKKLVLWCKVRFLWSNGQIYFANKT